MLAAAKSRSLGFSSCRPWERSAELQLSFSKGLIGARDNRRQDLRYLQSRESCVGVRQDWQYICLDGITSFFEQYTLGDGTGPQSIGCDNHSDPADENNGTGVWMAVPGSISYPSPKRPWESDYLLAVHGYNVGDWYKQNWFAPPIAKRLWHAGYRGGLGICYWPCIVSTASNWVTVFDNSE